MRRLVRAKEDAEQLLADPFDDKFKDTIGKLIKQLEGLKHADSDLASDLVDALQHRNDLARIARELFAEEHALIWAAHQVERWAQRMAEERCDDPPPRDDVLANVRNVLEHLDEIDFEGR